VVRLTQLDSSLVSRSCEVAHQDAVLQPSLHFQAHWACQRSCAAQERGVQAPLLRCVSKSDKPICWMLAIHGCNIQFASRWQAGNGSVLRLWWHAQEFEKLAGRPYVVCFFNADAPMTVLPDTVSMRLRIMSARSCPQIHCAPAANWGGRTIG
jgi:hypothetical protein